MWPEFLSVLSQDIHLILVSDLTPCLLGDWLMVVWLTTDGSVRRRRIQPVVWEEREKEREKVHQMKSIRVGVSITLVCVCRQFYASLNLVNITDTTEPINTTIVENIFYWILYSHQFFFSPLIAFIQVCLLNCFFTFHFFWFYMIWFIAECFCNFDESIWGPNRLNSRAIIQIWIIIMNWWVFFCN